MKIKLFAAFRDGWDGSYSVKLFGTRDEALKHLDRTEEQLEDDNVYEDGAIEETEIEIDENGVIITPGRMSFG